MDKGDVVHTHTNTHTQPKKKKDILTFATTWMDIEVIIPSEVSQIEKKILLYMCCMLSLTCGI